MNSSLAAPFNLALRHGCVYFADGGVSEVYQLRGSTLRTTRKVRSPVMSRAWTCPATDAPPAYTSVESEEGGGKGRSALKNGKLTISARGRPR